MLDLKHLAIRYRLGLLNTESLVEIADKLLEEGRDAPSVIQLSILESPIMAEAAPIFENICAEYKIKIPTKDEAINKLLRFQSESIASGAIAPRKGLEATMRESYFPYFAGELSKKYVGDSRGMEHLIGAYWSYDDLVERPRQVSWSGKYGAEAIESWEESVRQYARDWIQKHDSVLASAQ
jgi:hypothetical protein